MTKNQGYQVVLNETGVVVGVVNTSLDAVKKAFSRIGHAHEIIEHNYHFYLVAESTTEATDRARILLEDVYRRQDRKETLSNIFDELVKERALQDDYWGGPSHDDGHSLMRWAAILVILAARLIPYDKNMDDDCRGFRYIAIQLAATTIAAIEAIDRKLKNEKND